MKELHIIHPGTLATVQDLGRAGFASMGVPVGGAADSISLRLGNRLVGNPDGAAAVEFSLSGGHVRFERDAIIAITGIDDRGESVRPEIDGVAAPMWTALHVPAGEEIRLGAFGVGARAYLCVRGGIDTPPVLGSRSTHCAGGLGGLDGRALRAGDRLPVCNETPRPRRVLAASVRATVQLALRRQRLRMVPGPFADGLPVPLDDLCGRDIWTVSGHSDRVGVRIQGREMVVAGSGSMITEGVTHGTIQAPGGGLWIILGPDGPTTGGYPIVGTVIGADLPALGQLRPRDRVRLVPCSVAEALAAYRELWRVLDQAIPAEGS